MQLSPSLVCMVQRGENAAASDEQCECINHVAGVGTVQMIELNGKMAAALRAQPGTPFALVANFAVQPTLRGRGIGRTLLRACEQTVRERFVPLPRSMLLLVYRDNPVAIQLYKSHGFVECSEWIDPAWLEDAEKGRLGNSKRLLFVKDLN